MTLAEQLAEKYHVGGVLEIEDNGGTFGANFLTYNNAIAAINEAIERCAVVCDSDANKWSNTGEKETDKHLRHWAFTRECEANELASFIRALKG